MIALLIYHAHVMESSWMVLRLGSDMNKFSFLKDIFGDHVLDK